MTTGSATLGIHSFVWTPSWSTDACERAVARSAECGFGLVEVSTLDLDEIDVAHTRRTLDRHRMRSAFSAGLDAEHDVSSLDPERRRRGEQRLERQLAIARDIGAHYMCGILYSAFQKYDRSPTVDGIAHSVEIIRRLGERAAASGITLGLEVVNRYETNVLNTAAQGVAFCRRVGLPNVRVHLDCYHMNIEEADLAAAITETGDYLGYFHTGDSNRGYLGSGSIDFSRIFRALASIGYDGPITYESFSAKVVGQPTEGILGIWRELWTDSDDLARHALLYTQAQIKAAREARAVMT